MNFSEYIVTEGTGSSIDPLGFLGPSSALAGTLFRQFTVLSNKPAYLGFLCFAFSHLAKAGKSPGTRGFSEEFRNAETLWGWLNFKAGTSILNVTKYAALDSKQDISLANVRKYRPLYGTLNYGTLGHYASPAILWGLLDPKGQQLTDAGKRLAECWSHRAGMRFAPLMDAWLEGKNIQAIGGFAEASAAFHLDAPPARSECLLWQEIIDTYCARHPAIAPLWTNPVPAQILSLADDEKQFPGYYINLKEHFRNEAMLLERIECIRRFERLQALVQFVFSWEYVRLLDQVKPTGLAAPTVSARVQEVLRTEAIEYISRPGFRDAGKLFVQLAGTVNYDKLSAAVLAHHATHQRAKGASPFVQDGQVLIQDRVDAQGFATFLERVRVEAPNTMDNLIAWNYRRNWHFKRAATWMSYAGVGHA